MPTIFGMERKHDGGGVRDYIHVDDVVEANMLALQRGLMKGVFNVGTGIPTNTAHLLDLINGLLGQRLIPEYADPREGDTPFSVLDNKKLKSWGWRPQVDLLEGLNGLINP